MAKIQHCLSVLALAGLCAFGQEVVWEKGGCNGSFISTAENLISGMDGQLTDGVYGFMRFSSVALNNNAVKTYNFASPVSVGEVRIYSSYGDSGRDAVKIASIFLTPENGEPFEVSPSSIDSNSTVGGNYAILKRTDGSALGENIVSITINFGAQENGQAWYDEIEVVPPSYSKDYFVIEGADDLGRSVPAYGRYAHLAEGATLSVAAEEGEIACKGRRVQCLGWELYEWSSVANDFVLKESSIEENRYAFSAEHGGEMLKLKWLWEDVGEAPFEVFYVSPTGSDENDGTSDAPFATINKAQTVVHDRSKVVLLPGTYSLSLPLLLVKSIVFEGATGIAEDVVIDAQNKCSAVAVYGSSVLKGVTVRRGNGIVGGITINDSATVTDCLIEDCQGGSAANLGGGGVCVFSPNGVLKNSRITRCRSGRQCYGYGVYNKAGKVLNCHIYDNYTNDNISYGIGLFQKEGSALTAGCFITNNTAKVIHLNHDCTLGVQIEGGEIRNSLIANNTMGRYTEGTSLGNNTSGIFVNGASAIVRNCTIVGNTIDHQKEGAAVRVKNGAVINSIIWDNYSLDATAEEVRLLSNYMDAGANKITYSCTLPELADENSISFSPRFKNPLSDWRLSKTSPCADKGQNEGYADIASSMDLAGKRRLFGSRIDMGCYEVQQIATILSVK